VIGDYGDYTELCKLFYCWCVWFICLSYIWYQSVITHLLVTMVTTMHYVVTGDYGDYTGCCKGFILINFNSFTGDWWPHRIVQLVLFLIAMISIPLVYGIYKLYPIYRWLVIMVTTLDTANDCIVINYNSFTGDWWLRDYTGLCNW
jgi:hypothetical protein